MHDVAKQCFTDIQFKSSATVEFHTTNKIHRTGLSLVPLLSAHTSVTQIHNTTAVIHTVIVLTIDDKNLLESFVTSWISTAICANSNNIYSSLCLSHMYNKINAPKSCKNFCKLLQYFSISILLQPIMLAKWR